MVNLSNMNNMNNPPIKGRSVKDPGWEAEKRKQEQEALFDETVSEFVKCGYKLAMVTHENVSATVTGLQAAITRLGLDDEVEAWLDEDEEPPRAMLERM
jgi:hypothetical protein